MSMTDKDKAIQDILAIRQTMDKVSGAAIFRDFLYGMGSLLIIFGLLIILAIGATWYLNTFEIPHAGKWITVIWVILMLAGAISKTVLFQKKRKKFGLSFNEYMGKVLNSTFFGIDLPLEFGGFILVIYFIKIGNPVMILPLVTLLMGMLFGNLGHVFSEKSLQVFGYVFLIVSAFGFIPCNVNYYLYSLVAFGILYIVWGLALHNKSRKLESNKEQQNED